MIITAQSHIIQHSPYKLYNESYPSSTVIFLLVTWLESWSSYLVAATWISSSWALPSGSIYRCSYYANWSSNNLFSSTQTFKLPLTLFNCESKQFNKLSDQLVCLSVCLHFWNSSFKRFSSQSEHRLRLTIQSDDSILSAESSDISCSIKTQ